MDYKEKVIALLNSQELSKEQKEKLEGIFPELKESEDEKIRKAIHIYLDWLDGRKDYTPRGEYSIRDMISWLEKVGNIIKEWGDLKVRYIQDDLQEMVDLKQKTEQGEQKEATCVAEIIDRLSEKEQEILFKELDMQKEHNKFIESIQIGDQVTRNQDGMLVNLSQLKRVAKPSEKQVEQKPYASETNEEALAWLKKQRPSGCPEYCVMSNCSNCPYHPIVVKQNPADKVEPKFHEGDWIIHHGTENIYQVVAVIDNQYQLKYGDNYTIQNCADVDRCARLWDITKDAKDGDVLVCESGERTLECLFIFKLIADREVHEYCSYRTIDKHFSLKDSFLGYVDNVYHPATQEQRDLLFQKMKEAGYEWDSEKNKLKKTEQKPYPETLSKAIELYYYSYGNGKGGFDNLSLEKFKDIVKTFVDDYGMQKPAWSEEDENKVTLFMQLVEGCDNYEELSNWLKSLKDRVQPQPKQEWSEEEKSSIDRIIDVLDWAEDRGRISYSDWEDYVTYVRCLRPQPNTKWYKLDDIIQKKIINYFECQREIEPTRKDILNTWINWLKSLRPQNRWKPSDEQMEMVDKIINALSRMQLFGGRNALIDLKHDLEKLMEE